MPSRAFLFVSWTWITGGTASYVEVDLARVADLVRRMTLREKLDLTGTLSMSEHDPLEMRFIFLYIRQAFEWFKLKDNDRLNMRGLKMREGPRGMICVMLGMTSFGPPCPPNATSLSFPAQSLHGSTWDVKLEEEFGAAVGELANLLNVHTALLPCINIATWLHWGRAQETYGEDPFLVGKMGAAAVLGIQSQGVMATPKHFLPNNIDNSRNYVDASMDDKTLHEVYLRAWAGVVADSSPEMLMTSYSRVQGSLSNANPKLIRILRERLGFQGSIITDWFASLEALIKAVGSNPFKGLRDFIGAPAVLLKAGVDMEMPFSSHATQAVRELASCAAASTAACATANALDKAAGHIVRSKLRYGLDNMTLPTPESIADFNDTKYTALAHQIAQRGIVLLRNEAMCLPKRPEDVASVVVMGSPEILEHGDKDSSLVREYGRIVTVLEGMGCPVDQLTLEQDKQASGNGRSTGQVVTIYEGLKATYGETKVTCLSPEYANSDQVRIADLVVLDVGYDEQLKGEYPGALCGDRTYLRLHPGDVELILAAASVNPNVVVAITAGQSVIVEDFVDSVAAILWMSYPGPMGGQALADILSGKVNPSGRMTTVTPKRESDIVPDGIAVQPHAAGYVLQYPYAHGFKHMWGAGIQPRYPMGWGLSYASFSYGAPSLSSLGDFALAGTASLELGVKVHVKNNGSRAGTETVQVYVTCLTCRKKTLPIHLVGFATVHLAAGSTEEVQVRVSARDFAVYDENSGLWLLEAGTYTFLVGPCADRARLQGIEHIVDADVSFDYPGAAAPPDIPGVGDTDCSSYVCNPDAEFNQEEFQALVVARITGCLMLGLVLFFSAWCFCCCLKCCCYCRCRFQVRQEKAKDA